MTARETLSSCRAAVLELRKLDDQLARCLPTGQPSGLRAQRYDADPPGTNEPTAAAIQLFDGLMSQREKLASTVSRISKSVWDTLHSIKDARSLVILNNYYLLGMTDQDIAQTQDLTRETICRLRHEAIAALDDSL